MIEQVALIAKQGPREHLVRILAGKQTAVNSFDDVDTLLERAPDDGLSLIVLWAQDTTSGLANDIEPLARAFDQEPIVVACSSIERWGVRTALTAGASGIALVNDLDGSALRACIQAVQAGLTCVPKVHSRQIEPPALSSREKQILGLVVMGYTNAQIAQQLFLAESTVKSHLSSGFGKLGVRSRNEAVSLILDPDRGLGMGILALGGEPLMSGQLDAR